MPQEVVLSLLSLSVRNYLLWHKWWRLHGPPPWLASKLLRLHLHLWWPSGTIRPSPRVQFPWRPLAIGSWCSHFTIILVIAKLRVLLTLK
jgi:hypothetical protein